MRQGAEPASFASPRSSRSFPKKPATNKQAPVMAIVLSRKNFNQAALAFKKVHFRTREALKCLRREMLQHVRDADAVEEVLAVAFTALDGVGVRKVQKSSDRAG